MNSQRLCTVFLTLSLATGTAVMGCSKDEPAATTTKVEKIRKPAAEPKVKLSFKLNGKEKKKLSALNKKIDRKKKTYPSKEVTNKSNARLFIYSAAVASKKEQTVAALAALGRGYGQGKQQAKADADFAAVVSYHLKSKDPQILSMALAAAAAGVESPGVSQTLIADVLQLAPQYASGPGQHAVLNVFRNVPADQQTDATVNLFTASLDSKDVPVLTTALRGLTQASKAVKDVGPVVEHAIALAKHEDAGVRGSAVELLGALGASHPETGTAATTGALTAALTDKDGFVRGQACNALAALGQRAGIHALIPLVDDTAAATYVLTGWTRLGGFPGKIGQKSSSSGLVSDAATQAIATLSGGALKLEPVVDSEAAAGAKRNAESAKTWYTAEKQNIPTKFAAPPAASAKVPSSLKDSKATPSTIAVKAAAAPKSAVAVPATPAAPKPAAPNPAPANP